MRTVAGDWLELAREMDDEDDDWFRGYRSGILATLKALDLP